MNHLAKGAPLPVSLGRCADLLHDVRQLRLEMQRQTDEIEGREREIQDHLIASFGVNDPGAVGQRYMAKVVSSKKPAVKDWAAFGDWLVKYGAVDCVQRRLNEEAVMTRAEAAGMLPPGVESVNVKKISLTKV